MTTLFPTPSKHVTNVLFPKKEYRNIEDTDISYATKKPEILHIRSVFPFDPFPNSLIVDNDTVTIVHRGFPPTEHIETLPIEVITDVRLHRGILLSSLEIVAANIRNPISMTIIKLRPNDASCAHRVLECLMSLKRQTKGKEVYPGGNGSSIPTIGTYPN